MPNIEPSKDRTAKGQFAVGNQVNPSGPVHVPKIVSARYDQAVRRNCTEEDWAEIVKAVVKEAKKPNLKAVDTLMKLLGLPLDPDLLKRNENRFKIQIEYTQSEPASDDYADAINTTAHEASDT